MLLCLLLVAKVDFFFTLSGTRTDARDARAGGQRSAGQGKARQGYNGIRLSCCFGSWLHLSHIVVTSILNKHMAISVSHFV